MKRCFLIWTQSNVINLSSRFLKDVYLQINSVKMSARIYIFLSRGKEANKNRDASAIQQPINHDNTHADTKHRGQIERLDHAVKLVSLFDTSIIPTMYDRFITLVGLLTPGSTQKEVVEDTCRYISIHSRKASTAERICSRDSRHNGNRIPQKHSRIYYTISFSLFLESASAGERKIHNRWREYITSKREKKSITHLASLI